MKLGCSSGGPSGRPVVASHSCAVPLAARGNGLAVGPERHRTNPARMLQHHAERIAGSGIPRPRRLIEGPRQNGLTVGAERHRLDYS